MKRNGIFLVLLLFVLAFAPGCASIVSRSSYPVMIDSTPDGAEVIVTDHYGKEFASGVTPLHVTLKSYRSMFAKADYLVKFRKPGYREVALSLNATIDGWYFGNLLLPGGLIGLLIVDPATGAMWQLETDYLHATLRPEELAGLTVLDISQATDEMKAHMIPIARD
jgi:hypothetical protein